MLLGITFFATFWADQQVGGPSSCSVHCLRRAQQPWVAAAAARAAAATPAHSTPPPSLQSPAALRRLPAEPDIEGRIRTQLEDLGRICPGRPRYTSCDGADRANWTWAVLTRICCHTAPGLGQWHTFRLLTHLRSGQRVGAGGDTWNVRLEDPASGSLLRARVLDDGDGGYTVAFVPLQPGMWMRKWWQRGVCVGATGGLAAQPFVPPALQGEV